MVYVIVSRIVDVVVYCLVNNSLRVCYKLVENAKISVLVWYFDDNSFLPYNLLLHLCRVLFYKKKNQCIIEKFDWIVLSEYSKSFIIIISFQYNKKMCFHWNGMSVEIWLKIVWRCCHYINVRLLWFFECFSILFVHVHNLQNINMTSWWC